MKRFLHVFGCAPALGAVAGGAACAHHTLEAAAPSVIQGTFAVRLHVADVVQPEVGDVARGRTVEVDRVGRAHLGVGRECDKEKIATLG